jgi:hypothetical protein
VLKKAGIVVATAAAGLLAVSPLAFAGDKDDHDHHRDHDGHKRVKVERVEKSEDQINEAEQGLVARPIAINICNNGDFGDDYWGAFSWLQPPTSVDEDRNCYQRAESSVESEQGIEQENDD